MPVYLMRFSYTPETWSRLIQNPEDRRDAARAYIEQVGGALHGFWYGFGEYDGYAIYEAPDNVSIIGCDAANGTYFQLYSDERGVCRVYEMSIGDGEWRLWREGAPFSQRFTGRFEDDGDTIVGRWELAEDGTNYETDFDLIYRRVKGHRSR